MSTRPLALLGGAFDPVHHGHLRLALATAEGLGADVRLVPSGTPPHRAPAHANTTHRLEMLALAIEGEPRIQVDAREILKPAVAYSVETLREFRADIGTERSLMLVIGADQFAALDSWHEWRSLTDLAHLVVFPRPGHPVQVATEVERFHASRWTEDAAALRAQPYGLALRIDHRLMEISSSDIRARLANGRSPRWLLPDCVLSYLLQHGLYASPDRTGR